jgi:Holliday junction resolvase RusA-like endonuclease
MRYRVHIPAKAVSKGRARFSRKTGVAFTPKATVVAEAWVRAAVVNAVGSPRVPGPVAVRAVFVMPIPKSRPKGWREAALAGRILHTARPDVDNLGKLLADALNGIAWADDSAVAVLSLVKRYGDEPCTVIEWWTMTPDECAAEADVAGSKKQSSLVAAEAGVAGSKKQSSLAAADGPGMPAQAGQASAGLL